MEDLSVKSFSDSKSFFDAILKDFSKAKKSVYLETFKFDDSGLGKKIVEILTKKAEQGVKVMLLLDDWGTTAGTEFFLKLKNSGAEIKFFRKFKFMVKRFSHVFSYNNRRDHRKLIVIDDDLTYIGSSNITNYSVNWREFNLRIQNKEINSASKKMFLDIYKVHNFFFHSPKKHIAPIRFKNLEFLRDVPSLRFKKIRNKLKHEIRKAKKQIIIETPYFVPDPGLLFLLKSASKRGVDVTIILPKKSDVKVVDILMKSFYGFLHKNKVKLLFYNKSFNHSKVFLFDSKYFCFGSANFDYRSLIYQYELNLAGTNPLVLRRVKKHLDESIKGCEYFDYKAWKNRSWTHKLFERILGLIKKIF